MKKIITIVLTFLFIYVPSQDKKEYVYLTRQTDSARTFKWAIAGKPVTFFLQYEVNSDCSMYFYSVKGWYYYDNYRIKIPLLGYYNGNSFFIISRKMMKKNLFINFRQENLYQKTS